MNARSAMPLVMMLLAAASAPAQAPTAGSQLPAGTEPWGPAAVVAKEDSAPVRTEPGFVYREIRFLKKGQEIVVDGRKGGWFHVRPEGWVLADHVLLPGEAAAPAPAEPVAANPRFAPVREGVRVRASPSTDAAVARTLSASDVVEVTGKEAGWWKLADGGYVAETLLKPADGATPAGAAAGLPEPAATGRALPWVVAADSANVRAERSTTAGLVRKLTRGELIAVSGVQDGWAEVPGGWVRADLLQAPEPPSAAGGAPERLPRPQGDLVPAGARKWILVDLSGVVFEITDLTKSPIVPVIRREMAAVGNLEDDWTFLGLTIGVPPESPYRFNYAPDRNTSVVTDLDGQKYGNIYARGPIQKLPAHIRQFFVPMTVGQGEKFDSVIMFRPTLKPQNIKDIQMFIGGRMQRFYEVR